jgi:putative serine/threonine protein kinase
MIPKKYQIYNPEYFDKGKRSIIYSFNKKDTKYIIKTEKPGIQAKERLKNEAKFLKILNQHDIGPKIIDHGTNYICYKFIKGKPLLEYLRTTKNKKQILKQILKQCRTLDELKINKLEMHKPVKHIYIYRNKARMIDFERCYYTNKPKNVTQFIQFILRLNKELNIKININIKEIKEYKKNPTKKNFEIILNKL